MNKAASFCGFIIIVIGTLVLMVSAATLSPYQADYTGVGYGITTIIAGLLITVAGGISQSPIQLESYAPVRTIIPQTQMSAKDRKQPQTPKNDSQTPYPNTRPNEKS